jgi:hypothetical protein
MRNGPLRKYIQERIQSRVPTWLGGVKITNVKWAQNREGFLVTINNRKEFFTFEQLGLDRFKIAILQKQGQICNSKGTSCYKTVKPIRRKYRSIE